MNKERIIAEYQKISQKIQRNKQKGYCTDNLERALEKIVALAKEKKVKLYKLEGK